MNNYSLEIKYSKSDECYLGSCPELSPYCNMGGAIAHGSTWEECAKETSIAVQLLTETLRDKGIELPLPVLYVT
jgi:predicted RNase H-like HicB family nuclease